MSLQLTKYYSVSEYEKDINVFLKCKEDERYRLHFLSPQLKHREEMLMKIITIINKLRLSERTLHLAVYILDVYMDCHDISLKRLKLVCFACISIAAKYEENDENTPKISDFLPYFEGEINKGQFMSMEYMLLKFMQWKFIPTAAHFAAYYVQYAVSCDDISPYASGDELMLAVRQYMKMFLRLSLMDKRLMNEQRSLIGAACVAATREKLGLYPIWPNAMVQISGYSSHQLCAYARMLILLRKHHIYRNVPPQIKQ